MLFIIVFFNVHVEKNRFKTRVVKIGLAAEFLSSAEAVHCYSRKYLTCYGADVMQYTAEQLVPES